MSGPDYEAALRAEAARKVAEERSRAAGRKPDPVDLEQAELNEIQERQAIAARQAEAVRELQGAKVDHAAGMPWVVRHAEPAAPPVPPLPDSAIPSGARCQHCLVGLAGRETVCVVSWGDPRRGMVGAFCTDLCSVYYRRAHANRLLYGAGPQGLASQLLDLIEGSKDLAARAEQVRETVLMDLQRNRWVPASAFPKT